ncbi:MAG: fumarate hydratase [Deltaproteobacteria bacterium]|jgi:fumarate hydratase subunit alpha|nr:fumarate hydratase [Deltaproteobacteria bacterium]
MREITCDEISRAVSEMCVEANCLMAPDIRAALEKARDSESSVVAVEVLAAILKNAEIAEEKHLPLCQDTGMAVVFLDVGQDVHIVGGNVREAVDAGVARGYKEGYLRKSVVADPVDRRNTRDNTPAIIHYELVPGDRLTVSAAPKGFGSENMSAVHMLKPSQGLEGIGDAVVGTVARAGPNPCPPVIVGVGVGGTMERAAVLAKRALLRPVGEPSPDPFWAGVENDLLARINRLDIGPAGFGGKTSALAVHVLPSATHIAGLPVAVNISCHVTRHRTRVL